MKATRTFTTSPLFWTSAAIIGVSITIAAVFLALGIGMPSDIGPTAIPAAAFVFALFVFIAWLVCLPFRAGGKSILVIALALSLGFQWAMYKVFGTFMLYTPEELEQNRAGVPVLMALEFFCWVIGMLTWSSLSRLAKGAKHAA